HYTVFNCSSLCWMAHRRQQWEKLAEAAAVGEEAARVVGHQMELCEFLMWQAALARRDGEERLARRLDAAATAQLARVRMPFGPRATEMNNLSDWIVERELAYHEAGDAEREFLADGWNRAFKFRETDPDQAIQVLYEARQLAEQLEEPWWMMVADHWRLSAM